ncbi:MAG: hypothetical protein F7B19_05530 [Desulfurococcales archaeon]|nr:hypothetical protein [Desulfurococcales archaeon]MCE4626483.1 hypothetical protein [Desulfurococcales archaeon]
MSRTFIVRRYAAVASIAGGLFGVVLGVLSATGVMQAIDPLLRGVIGVIASAIIGVLVTPLGVGFKYKLSKSVFIESALASVISTLIVWPVVYSMLL